LREEEHPEKLVRKEIEDMLETVGKDEL